jgi:MFS superfamily sulfate permease-like transporter
MADAAQSHSMSWPVLRSLAGWRLQDLPRDLAAGLTLAAIAVPEQMATAKLGGFAPSSGLLVFALASLAFAVFGANRYLSSGADSTITPIFAGALALLAAHGSPAYGAWAACLAVGTGLILIAAGIARMGWVANLLSVPITRGFLAGIAVHIAISQLPALLGIGDAQGALPVRFATLAAELSQTHATTLMLGLLVLAMALAGEIIVLPVPGALPGVAAATALVALFHLERHGVAVLGSAPPPLLRARLPSLSLEDWRSIGALAVLVAMVSMVQTAVTTRAFASVADPQDLNRDFIGVGAGNILAGLLGLYPVNASPPRTAAVKQAGGHSQIAGLTAAAGVALLAFCGPRLLDHIPDAALAGVLFAVALRIARPAEFVTVLRQSPAEFLLILATMTAIIVFPIELGVAIGIGLSLLHGVWTITRTRMITFEHVPGTSVWWPPSPQLAGETLADVRVVAFQAPLSFLNAEEFRTGMIAAIETGDPKLIVLEASSIVEIDFTAAQVLQEIIRRCHDAKIAFAIARLTSLRAQQALQRFGILQALGQDHVFHSVDEAIRRLGFYGARGSFVPRQPETR